MTALAQAETIKHNALTATAGKTFGVAASQVAAGTGLVAIAAALRRLEKRG